MGWGKSKLVVGLGNPSRKYSRDRHNVGFEVVYELAKKYKISLTEKSYSSLWGQGVIEGEKAVLLLPQTFMNLSGDALTAARKDQKVEPENILVIHDELDLPLGRVKFQFDAGAAGHRGVSSIIEALGTKAFYRIRLGISHPGSKDEVKDFVLSSFEAEEESSVGEMIQQAVQKAAEWVGGKRDGV